MSRPIAKRFMNSSSVSPSDSHVDMVSSRSTDLSPILSPLRKSGQHRRPTWAYNQAPKKGPSQSHKRRRLFTASELPEEMKALSKARGEAAAAILKARDAHQHALRLSAQVHQRERIVYCSMLHHSERQLLNVYKQHENNSTRFLGEIGKISNKTKQATTTRSPFFQHDEDDRFPPIITLTSVSDNENDNGKERDEPECATFSIK